MIEIKQKNLLLFLEGSAGARSAPQAIVRELLRAGIVDVTEAITLSFANASNFAFLCRSQISLLFVIAGRFSFQVVTALIASCLGF